MNEQLPLKRVFIGLVASAAACAAVSFAAGTIDKTVLVHPDRTSADCIHADSAEASVVALSHEETNNSRIAKLIDQTVSSSAFKSADADEPEFIVRPQAEEITAEETEESYEVEEWWKAGLSDYSETLEKEELIPIETSVPVETKPAEEDDEEEYY